MPKENFRFSVLNELRDLAKESERLADLIPPISILDGYFSAVKETAKKTQSCTSVKDIENIEFPPDITTVILGKRVIKNVDADTTETQRAHLHAEKYVHTSEDAADKNERSSKVVTAKESGSLQDTNIHTSNSRECEAKSLSAELGKSNQKPQLIQVSLPQKEVQKYPVKLTSENCPGSSQRLMETPVMNRTFNKLANNTVILDSTSATKSNEKSNIQTDNDIRITRSASKQKLQHSEGSTPQILIQSGSKRKSSPSKSGSNKKQKTTKPTKSRQPHSKQNPVSSFANKVKPVIVPCLKKSTSMTISKEKQIMEEIQKKEEKAVENRKKVLAERQLKVEENKKKRNEKMEKTLQKRLQMEKEKEERLEKKDGDKKAQNDASKECVKKAKPATILRTKELIDQHMKENNSVLALKQNETKGDFIFKTPNRKSSDSESYDLTPAPDSSTYDFSDDEDKPSGKPIPSWAQGVRLKLALTHQFYNPPNTDEIFGTYIEPPNLSEIFGVHKKIYTKRTSSAIWHSTPDLSFCR